MGCSQEYGRQKGIRVRDSWECRRDGLIDFLQILDQSPRVWSLFTARIGVLCGEWVGIKTEA